MESFGQVWVFPRDFPTVDFRHVLVGKIINSCSWVRSHTDSGINAKAMPVAMTREVLVLLVLPKFICRSRS